MRSWRHANDVKKRLLRESQAMRPGHSINGKELRLDRADDAGGCGLNIFSAENLDSKVRWIW